MSDLLNDLRFYSTSINEPEGGYRSLLWRAASELQRLEDLNSPVKCSDCKSKIERSGDWYRCFDCKSHLCELCVTKHFGDSYSPHHRKMESYKQTIEMLQDRLNRLRAEAQTWGAQE